MFHFAAETITDADNADDQALLTNTPAQAKLLLISLEQTLNGIVRYVNKMKSSPL